MHEVLWVVGLVMLGLEGLFAFVLLWLATVMPDLFRAIWMTPFVLGEWNGVGPRYFWMCWGFLAGWWMIGAALVIVSGLTS